MTTPDEVIARLRAEPDHEWHLSRNADGGAAAEDFIRHAAERNARPQADQDASRAAACRRALAAIEAGATTTREDHHHG